MKPQLASDIDFETATWPKIALPKIDGVRALNIDGKFVGRSLEPFTGYGLTEFFSTTVFSGLDGELVVGDDPRAENLCSVTSGAVSAFKGINQMADFNWWLFDYVTPLTIKMPYKERYEVLRDWFNNHPYDRLQLVPAQVCRDADEAVSMIEQALGQGYEGVIFRNPDALPKPGRPGKRTQEYMRYKPWMDSEILVTGITEGQSNQNEAVTNALGYTERSSSQAGMVPNGMVGSIQGVLLEDIISPVTGKVLFPKGLPITVSKGKLTAAKARHYFLNPQEIVGHVVKFQHMAHGTQDLPRFPGYLSHRALQDLG